MTKNQSLIDFIIKYIILLLIIIVIVISTWIYFSEGPKIIVLKKLGGFIVTDFMIGREGLLISVAAIFIGIYFSIFTVLLTVKNTSTIVKFGIKSFKDLIFFVQSAFWASFMYILYALFFPLIIKNINLNFFLFISELFLGVLILYMILTSVRVGVAFILVFKKDIGHIYTNIENEIEETEQTKEVLHKLKMFLDEYELEKSKKQAEEANSSSQFRNPKS